MGIQSSEPRVAPRLVMRHGACRLREGSEGDLALGKEGRSLGQVLQPKGLLSLVMSQAVKDCCSGLKKQFNKTLPSCGLVFVYICEWGRRNLLGRT